MVDSSVAVGGGPTGSSSSSVAEWTLLSSLGAAGEYLVIVNEFLLLLTRDGPVEYVCA